jgi:cell division transport system permease protein
MGIHRFAHMIRRSTDGLRRHPLLFLLSVATVSAAFLSFAATLTTAFNLDKLIDKWANAAEITIYLKSDVDEQDMAQLTKAVGALDGVARVESVNQTQARERFAKNLGAYADTVSELPESTFPATLEVYLRGELSLDAKGRRALSERISKVDMVSEVEVYDNWFERLYAVNTIGQIAAWGLGLIALIVAILVVAAVVRASIGARRREIEVLRLVGATERYVRFPFLMEGVFQGILAMVFALAALQFLLDYLQNLMHDVLPMIGAGAVVGLAPTTLLALLAGSALTGLIGARWSLNSQRAVW